MPAAERILVRGVNWLGDAVMTTPALQRLREARPEAHITLLTHQKLADLWRGHPSLNATLAFSGDDNVFGVARRLRAERFDLAIVFPNSLRSALEVFAARIPTRVGYARNGRSLFLTRALPVREDAVRMQKRSVPEIDQRVEKNLPRETFSSAAHHVHDYLQLVAALGANPLPVPPLLHVAGEEISAARVRLGLKAGSVFVGLNPGAEYGPAKRWPAERFVEVAVRVHRETQCSFVLLGGRADLELAGEIAAAIASQIGTTHVTNVAGQTTLRELCSVLKACAVVVTNDTGPMHVAAAVGTPVVVPFGSTAPELTGPTLGVAAHKLVSGPAPCAPCFRRECPIDFRCMTGISVDRIAQATLQVLQVHC
jgi:heptosyltransferase-2